jgi:purine-binding chemotaxis protein CheW
VVDLRKRFGEARIAANKKNRVIVAEVEDRLVGLLVDSASEVFKIPPGDVEPPPSLFGEGELNYVKGIARYRGQLIILVELARILQHGELKRLSTIADMAVAE